MKIKKPLISEVYDVFHVRQVTRHTSLEARVAVDLVYVAPRKTSEAHRHNKSDTVLLILSGQGKVGVGRKLFAVKEGDRIHIPPGAAHYVKTGARPIRFVSVQTPPILDKKTGHLDLEKV